MEYLLKGILGIAVIGGVFIASSREDFSLEEISKYLNVIAITIGLLLFFILFFIV